MLLPLYSYATHGRRLNIVSVKAVVVSANFAFLELDMFYLLVGQCQSIACDSYTLMFDFSGKTSQVSILPWIPSVAGTGFASCSLGKLMLFARMIRHSAWR